MRRSVAVLIAIAALLAASCAPSEGRASESLVSARALNSWSAQLELTPGQGSVQMEILRDSRPIDLFAVTAGQPITYTDYLLWPERTFDYEIRGYDASGRMIDTRHVAVETPAQFGDLPPLYGAASFWNQPIAAGAAADPGSPAMVAKALVPYKSAANFWAGSNSWAKPLAYANPVSPSYAVGCQKYDCKTEVAFRIPLYAAPSTGSDHHLVVIDSGTGKELDMWLASYDAATRNWSAGARYVNDPGGWGATCAEKQHCGGAGAAGFAPLRGIVPPGGIAPGHIAHPLFFTPPYTRPDYTPLPAPPTHGPAPYPAAHPQS